jgi:squalene-hopene/tetraprenyl-beta-curcumene cyclase
MFADVEDRTGFEDLPGVREAIRNATEHLLGLQDPEGWWKGELETNVSMDAEDLMLRVFLGILDPKRTERSARFIRRSQREDGTWATFYGGPGDLSVSTEAYVALRIAGDRPSEPHMRKAASFIRSQGGIAACRVFTRIWLSLFGLWDWGRVPIIPPEIGLLPPNVPLNLYDFACWARQTVAALSVVSAYRPTRPIGFDLDELSVPVDPPERRYPLTSWEGRFQLLNELLARWEQLAWKPLRRRALLRMESWILRRQEQDGCWGGIQPPMVYSIIALHLLGYPLSHPVMQKGLAALDSYCVDEGDERRIEACQSPIWDTALSTIALLDAGVPPEHPQLQQTARWLVSKQILRPGDWRVRRPWLEPGGWAFEFYNDNYPDVDDTAEVILALSRLQSKAPMDLAPAISRGVAWTVGMQSRDGGWGAFDADNTSRLVERLPFSDFGEVTDPPSADVTAHVVEMLAARREHLQVMRRGISWLWRNQEPDGSWFGRWGANYIYGTWSALCALRAAGIEAEDSRLRRARDWLLAHQNPDGGWGEDLRSYVDPSWRGRGESTASQTAWAILGLLALGERGEATRAGISWLIENQKPDGGWDEPYFTGTGFPGDFYINYHLYRDIFPTSALGRALVSGDLPMLEAG